MNRVMRAWGGRTLAGLAFLALLVGLAFPLLARAYAAGSIPEAPTAAPGAGAGPAELELTRVKGLGYRTLPLLTDAARESWINDGISSVTVRAESLFGADWPSYLEAARVAAVSPARGKSGAPFGDYPFNYGPAESFLAQHLAASQLAKPDVTNLTSLLLLVGSSTTGYVDASDQPAYLVAAYALGKAAALGSATCEAQLEQAHLLTLRQLTPEAAIAGAFGEAVTACGSDPSAAMASAYQALFDKVPIACTPDPGTARDWQPVIDAFAKVEKLAPASPAGYLGESNAYRVAAASLAANGNQPFAVREFRQRSVHAAQEAVRRTSSPVAALALARAEVADGNASAAQTALASVAADFPLEALEVGAEAKALDENFAEAVRLAEDGANGDGTLTSALAPEAGLPVALRSLAGFEAARDVTLLEFAGGCGGSLVRDYGFAPQSRPIEGESLYAPAVLYSVLGRLPAPDMYCMDTDPANDALCALVGGGPDAGGDEASFDLAQNLFREHGLVNEAERCVRAWVAAYPQSAQAADRLGEVLFLEKKWSEAAKAEQTAAELYNANQPRESEESPRLSDLAGPGWAILRRAAAVREGGDPQAALKLVDSAHERQLHWSRSDTDVALLDMYIAQERGTVHYALKQYVDCIREMDQSVKLGRVLETGNRGNYVLRGAQEQTASAAAIELKDTAKATQLAKEAAAIDPFNPLYREAVGESVSFESKPEAIEAYRAGVQADPTLFSSWNNMGVLLAQTGQDAEAAKAFENAVAVRPTYAIGWFNLGTVEGSRGLPGFLRSEGALGKAIALDSSLRNRDPVVQLDTDVYASGLDVSKSVPAEWQLTSTVRSDPRRITIVLAVIVALRVLWALGLDKLLEVAVTRVLGRGRRGQHDHLRWMRIPTGLLTAAVSLWALLHLAGVSGTAEAAVCGVLIGALLLAHGMAPYLRRGTAPIRHISFLPASVLTGALAVGGFGFAPPAPLDEGETPGRWTRLSGPSVIAVLAAGFVLVALTTSVPLAHAVAGASVTLFSSALIPVKPLDGGHLALGRVLDLGVTALLGVATALFAGGWL